MTPSARPVLPSEEWDYLDVDVLRPARSGAVHHLPALPLRDRQALRHRAHLSDPSGSDPPGRAPDQAVRSVGASPSCFKPYVRLPEILLGLKKVTSRTLFENP